jgi:hypothetical protein
LRSQRGGASAARCRRALISVWKDEHALAA